MDETLTIPVRGAGLTGDLSVPQGARGLVVFAHGAGSSRLSPRNRAVAAALRDSGTFGTLLFDLLTEDEDGLPGMRFDIVLLAERLAEVTGWVRALPATSGLACGYFGASTGAAAALMAAAELGGFIDAVVSRGGRPDLAGESLRRVTSPTLLIVGGADLEVLDLNRRAYAQLAGVKDLAVVPGATHLFEERGALERVTELAASWFERYLGVA
jgi:pimeloyl-ACP methyl ester carboxylesterase